MGPTWVLSAPDGPHVGPMNIAIMDVFLDMLTLHTPQLQGHLYYMQGLIRCCYLIVNTILYKITHVCEYLIVINILAG